jgi:hypothetical protein
MSLCKDRCYQWLKYENSLNDQEKRGKWGQVRGKTDAKTIKAKLVIFLFIKMVEFIRACLKFIFRNCYDAIFVQTRRILKPISERIWAINATQYEQK